MALDANTSRFALMIPKLGDDALTVNAFEILNHALSKDYECRLNVTSPKRLKLPELTSLPACLILETSQKKKRYHRKGWAAHST